MNVTAPLQQDLALSSVEQQYRAGAYQLLGALLRDIPDAALLNQTASLANSMDSIAKGDADPDPLVQAMHALGLSAQQVSLDALNDEYHQLFIGLGRGEVIPFASWYLTGYLMEQPLSALRNDLSTLGYERDPQVKEPEDHVAALCEVMAMMIQDNHSSRQQYAFFSRHLVKWLPRFFNDLGNAPSAVFYQSVARFGTELIAFETQYFDLAI